MRGARDGQRRGIVFIHGGLHTAWCWRRVVGLVSLPSVAIDLPGRGLRPGQPAALNTSDFVAAAAAEIDRTEWDDVVVVAHSLGGVTALGLCAAMPDRISHVVFISDTPTLGQWVPDCVSGHLSDVRPCTVSVRAGTLFPTIKARELSLAKREHVSTVDPTPWFCAPTVCPVIVGNILVYRDNAHMTPAWSRFIAPVLANALLTDMDGTG